MNLIFWGTKEYFLAKLDHHNIMEDEQQLFTTKMNKYYHQDLEKNPQAKNLRNYYKFHTPLISSNVYKTCRNCSRISEHQEDGTFNVVHMPH